MKKHASRIRDHILGPTGSVILHVVVVVLLFKLVLFRAPDQQPEVEVMMLEAETVDLDELREQLKELEDIQVVQTVEVPEVSLEEPVMDDVEDFQAEDPEVDFAALDMLDDVQGPLVMSGLYAARSDEGRKGALRKYAGGVARYTETSVLKALEWLKENQEADGAWDKVERNNMGSDVDRSSMTGLGLLTFLAHGETPTSEDYGETVEMAIRYLVSAQKPDGRFCKTTSGPGVYAHAIATYAVSEAYGLTQIPALREAMEKSARVIVEGQQAGGGWDYGYKNEGRRDTSVTGWQVQALKAAYIAKAGVPGIEDALEKASRDLTSAQVGNGRFAYSNKDARATPSMTGVGVLCLQLAGEGKKSPVRRGIAALEDVAIDWDKGGGHALYSWYYITQAKFHQGGSTWSRWNNEFARLYTKMQNEDGSWTSPGEGETLYGPVYSTTLAALTLQVYYRLLPTYQADAVAPGEEEDFEEEEDLIEVI